MKRPLVRVQPREQQDMAASRHVLLIPPTRLAVRPRDRLTLPVDELAADGVVAVAGRRGERAAGLVQRERQQVGGERLHIADARLPRRHPHPLAHAARGEDLDAGVAGVDVERHLGEDLEFRGDV